MTVFVTMSISKIWKDTVPSEAFCKPIGVRLSYVICYCRTVVEFDYDLQEVTIFWGKRDFKGGILGCCERSKWLLRRVVAN